MKNFRISRAGNKYLSERKINIIKRLVRPKKSKIIFKSEGNKSKPSRSSRKFDGYETSIVYLWASLKAFLSARAARRKGVKKLTNCIMKSRGLRLETSHYLRLLPREPWRSVFYRNGKSGKDAIYLYMYKKRTCFIKHHSVHIARSRAPKQTTIDESIRYTYIHCE